jgi:hypothetical protein
MYYSFPSQNAAYDNPSQYMFGDSILVSPVVSHGDNATGLANKTVWLPSHGGVAAVLTSFLAAVSTEMYLCNICSGQEILSSATAAPRH